MAFVSDVPAIERACIAGDEALELLFCHDTAREARVPLLFVHGAMWARGAGRKVSCPGSRRAVFPFMRSA
jgi:hypothetical protein